MSAPSHTSASPSLGSSPPAGSAALLIISVVGAFLAILGAGLTQDPIFRLQAETIALAGVIAAFALNGGLSGGTLVDHPDRYSDNVIKAGVIATMFWAAAGLLAGVVIAAQLSWPTIFYFPDAGWLNFGRLRPLHTSAVIFAFGGNVLIATSFFVVQKTCRKAKLAGRSCPVVRVLGYKLFIVIAGTGYLLGATQSKEYAEPEWYADLWLTIVWVTYLLVFLMTLVKRKEPHIFVANWFYLAFIITIAVLHLGNNPRCPSRSSAPSPMSPGPACRMPCSSGGTATTRWASSSPPASSPSCITSFRSAPSGRSIPIGCRSCTSGRSSSSISGPVRITCTIRHCPTGRRRSA
jgi:cytochrome c oxidase cbb3-type subunit 1